MTREEYFAQDIIDRIEQAVGVIAYPDGEDRFGDDTRDFLVWQDDGIGIHVTDVMHDAIVAIKRLRVALEAEDFRLAAGRRNEPIAPTLDEMRKKYGL